MKILHVPPRYYPAISGAEFYFKSISELLARRHDVQVETTNALDFRAFHDPKGKTVSLKEGETINSVPIQRHRITHDLKEKVREFNLIRKKIGIAGDFVFKSFEHGPYSPGVMEQMEKQEPDIIHTTCYPYMNIFAALASARKMNIPCVVTPFIHGENPRYQSKGVSSLKHFTCVLACSEVEREFLIGRGVDEDKIRKITMGVDVDRIQHAKNDKFLDFSGIDPKKNLVIVFSGYKNYEKGAITLIQTVEGVSAEFPRVRYVMIGPPTKQYNIEVQKLKHLKKHVINLSPSNLKGYYDEIKLGAFHSSSLYAMPSRSDAYGIAYLEAWACKKPIISSTIPVMRELFTNDREGKQVPFGDVLALQQAIISILKNEKLGKMMGSRGYQKIMDEELTWNHVSRVVGSIYDDLLG
ncbi:MAG: glycosyltransferase family 4 protein [Promethearchaeota archaeon]